MKRMTLLLGFVVMTSAVSLVAIYNWKAKAQEAEIVWGKQFGTDKNEYIDGVSIDGQGNIYVVGDTEGNLFGANAGREDIFIAKYSPEGNLLWGKQFGTTGKESPEKVAVDTDGNIYVVGYTNGNLFGKLVREYDDDAFVVKVSSKGEVMWAKQFGTPGVDWAEGITVDNKNRAVYVVGFYSVGEYGDPDAEVYVEDVRSEVFVIKYDFEGNKLWERQYGTKRHDMGNDVCIDRDGNVVIVGETEDWFSERELGGTNAFVAKLTSEGSLVWGREFGTKGRDYASAVCVDKEGNIYIIGVTNIGETWETRDTFVVKYDGNGNQLWLKEIRTEKEDRGAGIAVDGEGKVYVSGDSEGNLFGSNAGVSDIFLAKYSGDGTLIWGKMTGTEQAETSCDIALDGQGNIYFVGGTAGNWFGKNAGGADAFVAKMKR